MNRRDALKSLSLILGGAVFGSRNFLSGQINPDAETFASTFTIEDLAFLDEVGETILPATEDSAGAKAAKIGAFMQEILSTSYNDEERKTFMGGIRELNNVSRSHAGRGFMALSPEERYDLLLELEKEPSPPYYQMMKQLTLWGYFSSEIGATQALAHLPVPGRWDPCIPITPDTKPWS